MCRATNEARGGFVTVAPADVAMACSVSPCPTSPVLGQTVSVTVTGHFQLITPLLAFLFGGQNTIFASTASAQLVSTPTAVSVAGPVAEFDWNPKSGLTPLDVTVDDQSTGVGLTYSWGWGDETFAAGRLRPRIATRRAGSGQITLTVSNIGGTSVVQHDVTVSDPAPAPPVAIFNYSPPVGPAPLTVTFTDASTGTPTMWEWNFGDGQVASGPGSKTHTFMSPDVYHVSLKVTNAGGENTTTNDVQANLVCPSPISNFSVSPGTGRKTRRTSSQQPIAKHVDRGLQQRLVLELGGWLRPLLGREPAASPVQVARDLHHQPHDLESYATP